ncbi:vanadium-dependent haloperoxidase [Streptomyces sp. NPDC006610]|uniref:vanadium-dependent haloperoxidase n=1 Tax=Streptomyces sp. NPDC006610 TaxID=3154584 RepID=UPI0033BA2F5B
MDASPPSPRSHRTPRRTLLAALTALALAAAPWSATAAPERPPAPGAAGPQVILDWNRTAVATINTDARLYSAEQFLWHGFVSAAVYNAVVGIEGRYTPYKWDVRRPHGASAEAAAAAAAHEVLRTYFPSSRKRLDAAYAESLAKIPDGRAEERGVAFGRRAAEHVVRLRADDGRGARVTYAKAPAPGVWRPTPPTEAPFHAPWLAKTRPLLLDSAERVLPAAPPAPASRRYARDFAEIKAMGGRSGSLRTAWQTETARFYADVLPVQLQDAYRGHVERRGLDLVDAARLFAAANTATADASIAAWNAKYTHGQWRPVTAIRLAGTDGNPATEADPEWTPLLRTPPYPDYVSGHCTVDGAAVTVLDRLSGGDLDLRISSAVTGTTRTYTRAADFRRDVINARVWGGVHFRTSDVVGDRLGRDIGAFTLDHYFTPVDQEAD